jgi:hypothetical protein
MRLNPLGAFWQGGFPCALGPENGWKITGRGTIFCPLPREAFCSDPTPHREAPAAVYIPANFLKVPLRGTAGRPASLRLPPPRAPPSTPRLFPPHLPRRWRRPKRTPMGEKRPRRYGVACLYDKGAACLPSPHAERPEEVPADLQPDSVNPEKVRVTHGFER